MVKNRKKGDNSLRYLIILAIIAILSIVFITQQDITIIQKVDTEGDLVGKAFDKNLKEGNENEGEYEAGYERDPRIDNHNLFNDVIIID